MDRKELEIRLEKLRGYPDPSVELEQYVTPPSLSSRILHAAKTNNDLDPPVLDLGCGTGVFAVGASLLGTRSIGIDIDLEALKVAESNSRRAGVSDLTDWVQAEIDSLCLRMDDATVLMNPPFGAQHKGADRVFLEKAAMYGGVAYTIHNEGSLGFVESFVSDMGGEVTDAFRTSFILPNKFDFHTEESREINVEVYRITFG